MSFKDRFQARLADMRDKSQTAGSTIGVLTMAVIGVSLVGWPFYSYFFLERPVRQPEVKRSHYASSVQNDWPAPPATQEAEKTAEGPKTQPQSQPNTQQEKKQKPISPEQKVRREMALCAHYAGPLEKCWKKGGRSNSGGESQGTQTVSAQNQQPGQVLEVPPAQQANYPQRARGGNRNAPDGGARLWTRDFYDMETGQPGAYRSAQSPYEVTRGSVIRMRLLDPINTTVPGQISAEVVQDVMDSATGRYVMIPAGTTAIGGYPTRLAYGQKRLPTAWNEFIFPNSASLPIPSMPGVGPDGMAGLPIDIDNHYLRTATVGLMFTLTGAAANAASSGGYSGDFDDALQRQAGRELNQRARQTWDRGGIMGPTGMANVGQEFLIQLNSTLRFKGDYYKLNDPQYVGEDYAFGE